MAPPPEGWGIRTEAVHAPAFRLGSGISTTRKETGLYHDHVRMDPSDIRNFAYDAELCIRCKGCVWVDHIYMPSDVRFGKRCPSEKHYVFDSFAAYGRLRMMLAMLHGNLDYSPRVLEAIYACQLCGACDVGCRRNLDLEIEGALEALRIKAVQDGYGPMPEHRDLAQKI